MIDFDLTLTSDQVTLRPAKISDLDQLYAFTEDKSMWIYFTSDLSDRNELKEWLNTAVVERDNKSRLAFTVVYNATGKAIGSSSFGNISYRDKRIEIGWTWIAMEFQGKGINDRIKYMMLKYCFENQDFERVEFKTDVLNIPARKALLRIGATEEGVLRSHTLMTHNRRRDTIFYSILRAEWNNIRSRNGWQ